MVRIRRSGTTTSTGKLLELGVAAPQVVAHRLARMAAAGAAPSARDRREFTGMVVEKQVAFAQAWAAICFEAWRMQQRWLLAWFDSAPALPWRAAADLAAWERLAVRGITPVHRKAGANARRLGRG